ncbi:MAG: hypothetical protein AAF570_05430 [Bacteroidota bacterium]
MKIHTRCFLLLLLLGPICATAQTLTFQTEYLGGTFLNIGDVAPHPTDGYIIVGSDDSTSFFIRTDDGGVPISISAYPDSISDHIVRIIPSLNGGFVLFGHSLETQSQRAFLMETDPGGTPIWRRTYPLHSIVRAEATGANGFVFVGPKNNVDGHSIVVKVNAIGAVEWSRDIDGPVTNFAPSGIAQLPDGGYMLSGTAKVLGNTRQDIWLLKLSATGHLLHAKKLDGADLDTANDLHAASNGGAYVTGHMSSFGTDGMYVMKVDSIGDPEWTRVLSGGDFMEGQRIIEGVSSRILVSGTLRDGSDTDIVLAQFNEIATVDFIRRLDIGSDDASHALRQEASLRILIAGSTVNTNLHGLLLRLDPFNDFQCSGDTVTLPVEAQSPVVMDSMLADTSAGMDMVAGIPNLGSVGVAPILGCMTVDVEGEKEVGLSVWPVPAQDRVQLRFRAVSDMGILRVYDAMGRQLIREAFSAQPGALVERVLELEVRGIVWIEVEMEGQRMQKTAFFR